MTVKEFYELAKLRECEDDEIFIVDEMTDTKYKISSYDFVFVDGEVKLILER